MGGERSQIALRAVEHLVRVHFDGKKVATFCRDLSSDESRRANKVILAYKFVKLCRQVILHQALSRHEAHIIL